MTDLDLPRRRLNGGASVPIIRGMGLGAHFWTFWPLYHHRLWPQQASAGELFSTRVSDPLRGEVELNGRLTRADPRRLLVLVHGLGGSTESLYMLRAARIAEQIFGLSCLRLNMRGSDRRGDDFYHAGLVSDLGHVLEHPDLAGFQNIHLLGFSVGGHVVLRSATVPLDPRVRSVAAVCSPIDLAATVKDFDRPANWLYRRYILGGLKELYRAVDRRHDMPLPWSEIDAVTGLEEWDSKTVVPRFGFESAADYYRQASVCYHLSALRVPALLVASEGDPMVTSRSIRHGLRRLRGLAGGAEARDSGLEVRWMPRGGHVGFPARLDLGLDAPKGLDAQLQAWLLSTSP